MSPIREIHDQGDERGDEIGRVRCRFFDATENALYLSVVHIQPPRPA